MNDENDDQAQTYVTNDLDQSPNSKAMTEASKASNRHQPTAASNELTSKTKTNKRRSRSKSKPRKAGSGKSQSTDWVSLML